MRASTTRGYGELPFTISVYDKERVGEFCRCTSGPVAIRINNADLSFPTELRVGTKDLNQFH